ncbi:MAG TPA: DUF1569 domain-containing protein [Pyrinomonadaceae bacterium]|nr:DUF1569 domain-containing protein [Pyrinomonadaceae bacterium]
MGSILNDADRAAITERLRSLSVSSTRRWGSMDVTGMMKHLRLAALMNLGEYSVPSANKRAFQVFPLKHLILYVFPFPKSAPTAPALKIEKASSEFEEERAGLLEVIERIGKGSHEGAGPDHPLFGPLSWREWGVATYKHTDHHLKQFGA